MPNDRIPKLGRGQVALFVGTAKGMFVLRSRADRKSWSVAGPAFAQQAAQQTVVEEQEDAGDSYPDDGEPAQDDGPGDDDLFD